MFGMFKGKKDQPKVNQPPPPPPPADKAIKYEKVQHDMKVQIEIIDEQMDRYDQKTTKLDADIRELIARNKKQQAKGKIAEMKGYQKQIENLQIKRNTLTQMLIKIESIETDQQMAEVVIQAASIAKETQETNDKLQDAMMDWQEVQQQQEETQNLWKQMGEIGVDQGELDDEFAQYEQQVNAEQAQQLNQKFNQVPVYVQPQVQQQQQQQYNVSQQNTQLQSQIDGLLE